MNAAHRQKVIEAISMKAKEITPKGTEVILFGSQARGDARPDSDWDVLILLDKDKVTSRDMDDYSYPLRELGWDVNECINALLFTNSSFPPLKPFKNNEFRRISRITQMKTSFTNYTNLLRAGNRRLRRKFVKFVIIRTIREIRLNPLLKRKGWESSITKKEWQQNIASPFYENVTRDGIRL